MTRGERTALITGSGKNIGRGIALHLAESGFNIVLNGSRDRAACEEVASKIRELVWDFREQNGFTLLDITEGEVTARLFAWSSSDPLDSIDTLEPYHTASIRRP